MGKAGTTPVSRAKNDNFGQKGWDIGSVGASG
jgi:hypothetical protein